MGHSFVLKDKVLIVNKNVLKFSTDALNEILENQNMTTKMDEGHYNIIVDLVENCIKIWSKNEDLQRP